MDQPNHMFTTCVVKIVLLLSLVYFIFIDFIAIFLLSLTSSGWLKNLPLSWNLEEYELNLKTTSAICFQTETAYWNLIFQSKTSKNYYYYMVKCVLYIISQVILIYYWFLLIKSCPQLFLSSLHKSHLLDQDVQPEKCKEIRRILNLFSHFGRPKSSLFFSCVQNYYWKS